MNQNFYNDNDYKYTETAICIENTDTGMGKFYLPTITPMLSSVIPYDNIDPVVSTSNILSEINLSDIGKCTESNYIELQLPNGMMKASKGDKFSISFIGGEVNNPMITQKI